MKKRTRAGHAFFSKERNVLHSFAFFCIRTLRSLCSFMFLAKECCILCVLLRSLQKNVVFFAFFYVLKKRTHSSFGSHKMPKTQKKECKRTLHSLKEPKERCVQNGKESGAQPCPKMGKQHLFTNIC